MSHPLLRSGALLLALLAPGCAITGPGSASPPGSMASKGPSVLPDLAVARPPYHTVEVNWKQRLAQPYVYLETQGSYTRIGALLEELHARMDELSLTASGPPFGLYFDDPGRVPVDQLRMRACFPVDTGHRVAPPMAYDVLPSTTVVYGFVGGPYPDVPRAYPALFNFMDELGWVENGPVREVYLVNPAEVQSFSDLVTEVQVPSTSGR